MYSMNIRTFLLLLVIVCCAIEQGWSGRVTSRGSNRGSSWGRPARRPSPSRPSPNYGWNTPSRAPSYPAPSYPSSNTGWNSQARPSPSRPSPSRPAPSPPRPAPAPAPAPSYGWNAPSRPASPSHVPSSPSQVPSSPSRPAPNYGWNANAGSKTPASPGSRPAGQPAPNYGWNVASPGGVQGTGGTQAQKPWSVPGRDNPYSKQTAGTQQASWNKQPAAPPGGGQTGWNPDVNKQVNTGAQKPGWNAGGVDQANKKTVGTQQNYSPQAPGRANYGWNQPSGPSAPSNTPSSPSKPATNYGWNSNVASKKTPSHVPGQAPPSYGWNTNIASKTVPSAASKSGQAAPSYGWNAPASNVGGSKGGTGVQSNKPWSVPGRESPYNKQNAGSHQSGWNSKSSISPGAGPGNLNKQANTAVHKPGSNVGDADQANKKTLGTQQSSYSQGPGRPYPQQQYGPGYQPGYQPGTYGYQPHGYNPGGGHTTIINNNNYHTNYGGGFGYHTPPVFYPSYSYTYRDTGSTTLGFFLGYSLARLTTPTYRYYGPHDTYRPVYDHYEVHHYYHKSDTAPKQTEVPANNIAVCVGDSGNVCPPNTYALCTASGSIMCVADQSVTIPCANEKQVNCVKSTVPCVNNETEECRNRKPEEAATVNIPCIYTTNVLGNISFVNNTIILDQPPEPPKNITQSETAANVTLSQSAPPEAYPNTTMTTTASSISTSENSMTTTENSSSRKKRDVQLQGKQFCVTIVAEPAARKNLTENEILFNGAKNIFQKFAVKALGAD